METTICPWCQTEIVWDDELGPEEECPYCNNELKGYRTLNIQIAKEDEDLDVEENEGADSYWAEDEGEVHLNAIRRIERFTADGGDLLAYEAGVEKVLDAQDDVPECPHCREYMILAGSEKVNDVVQGFIAHKPQGWSESLVPNDLTVDVYICSACFHVSRFLSEEDRLSLIRKVSEHAE